MESKDNDRKKVNIRRQNSRRYSFKWIHFLYPLFFLCTTLRMFKVGLEAVPIRFICPFHLRIPYLAPITVTLLAVVYM